MRVCRSPKLVFKQPQADRFLEGRGRGRCRPVGWPPILYVVGTPYYRENRMCLHCVKSIYYCCTSKYMQYADGTSIVYHTVEVVCTFFVCVCGAALLSRVRAEIELYLAVRGVQPLAPAECVIFCCPRFHMNPYWLVHRFGVRVVATNSKGDG